MGEAPSGVTLARHTRSLHGPRLGRSFSTTDESPVRRAALVIDLVDHDRLDVSVDGWSLTAPNGEAIARRLDELISCNPVRLRVNFTAVSSVDPGVAAIFGRAASTLRDLGGTFEVTGTQPEVASRLGLPDTDTPTTVQVLAGAGTTSADGR